MELNRKLHFNQCVALHIDRVRLNILAKLRSAGRTVRRPLPPSKLDDSSSGVTLFNAMRSS